MKKKKNALKIIPLGGLNGIGKNITLFEYGDDIIVVDCGIMFPNDEMPGIDFIIPDFSYLEKHSDKVRGIVITHGHEDHIGAIPFLLKVVQAPVFATRLTMGLIQNRLKERLPEGNPELIEINPREPFTIGPFSIEGIRVNHSIADGVALALTTPIGTIIHTGDFKIDFTPVDGNITDLARFAEYGDDEVLLLMSDSTNAERKGYTPSETSLNDKLIDLFSGARGRIIVASFASNIHRIQQVLDTAQRFNRKVAISGMSMQRNIEIAKNLGYLDYKEDLIVDINKAGQYPSKKLVIVGTGSQGEPMSALSRMAAGTHKHFKAEKGDTVIITASVIPGNEKTVTAVVNSLMKTGADVFYENDERIHVSGHAASEELKLLLSLVKPKFFMPVHGEYKHLRAHTKIAEEMKVKPSRILIGGDGDILELTKSTFTKTGQLSLAQIYVDGKETGDIGSSLIKDRHTMSSDGIILVTITLSNGMLVRQPDVLHRGFVASSNNKTIHLIRKDIEEKVHKLLEKNTTPKEIRQRLLKGLSGTIFKMSRRNPLVDIQILEV